MIMDILVGAGIVVLIVGIGIFGFSGYLARLKAEAEHEIGESNKR